MCTHRTAGLARTTPARHPSFVPRWAGLLSREEATTLTDHFEQATTAVMVLRVGAEVVGEVVDSFGEKGDLHFGRTAVSLVFAVLLYGLSFLECHLEGYSAGPFSGVSLVLKSL